MVSVVCYQGRMMMMVWEETRRLGGTLKRRLRIGSLDPAPVIATLRLDKKS